jgi:hypothetical protein
LGRKVTAVIAALLLIGVGVYVVSNKTSPGVPGGEKISPRMAIPSIDGSGAHLYLEVTDTQSLASIVSFTSRMIAKSDELAIPGADAPNVVKAAVILGEVKDFIDASKSVALCATSDDVEGLFISMFVDDAKFDPLVASGDGREVRAEAWTERGADSWILRRSSDGETSGDALYVTRRRVGGESVVNMSNNAQSIDAMSSAMLGQSARFATERRTELPNFFRMKLTEPVVAEGLKFTEAEASWNRAPDLVATQWFSDLYAGVGERMASRDFSPAAPPLLGKGEVALIASLDPAFFIYTMLPGEADPVGSFFKRFVSGGSALPFAEDFEAIVRQCRVSAAIVTSGNSVETAYLALDTKATGALDKLFGMAGMFLGAGMELNGWSTALSIPSGGGVKVLLARRDGIVVLGVGEFGKYGVSMDVPEYARKIVSSSNAMGVYVNPSRLDVSEGALAEMISNSISDAVKQSDAFDILKDWFDLDNVDNITLTQEMNGRADVNIILRGK